MFDIIVDYLSSISPAYAALIATTFTWFVTAVGAAFVFFFKKMNRPFLDTMMGFTGGVMIAASFWSLLAPAINMSEGESFVKVMPAAIGFLGGALFIFVLDKILPHVHINFKKTEGIKTPWQRTTLLVLAITMHNIPEGLAVGVLFGVIEEVVPESQQDGNTDMATMGFIGGFIIMMVLDVALG